jgi:hypothetical protein
VNAYLGRALKLLTGAPTESLEAGALPLRALADQSEARAQMIRTAADKAGLLLDLAPPGLEDLQAAANQLAAAGAEALQRIGSAGPSAELTPLQLSGLEAIVRAEGRPSFLIQDGDFTGEPGPSWEWLALDPPRPGIQQAITSVGKLKLTGHPDGFTTAGTGWLGGQHVVVTNRHVLDLFAEPTPGGFKIRDGIKVTLDLRAEEARPHKREFEIKNIIGAFEKTKADLALLEVAEKTVDGEPLPPPLPISTAAAPKEGAKLYALGYPGFDPGQDSALLKRYFAGGIYGKKRFAPGESLPVGDERTLLHDCTTLKGSSGSCVLELGYPDSTRMVRHRVVGLHYSGSALRENRAVRLSALRDELLVRSAGLHYVP